MSTERWEKIKELFEETLKLDPTLRSAFLMDACGSDSELRIKVESLINSFEDAGGFLDGIAAEAVADQIVASERKLQTGKSFGHYEIVELIGSGGMGEVYLARDKRLDRSVAIKVLSEGYSRNESNLKRFIQEAKAASSLNHPNILVIHEIGEADGASFIVSELVSGKTLRDAMRSSRMKPAEILDIAIQIASALSAAHGKRIIHRDIKPENIMLREDGLVKVLDFGLAKLIDDKHSLFGPDGTADRPYQTARGVIMGTVNYMSPEQAKGNKVDERTDIFNLGILIYEMIAGKLPFGGDSPMETLANLVNTEPTQLSHYASNVNNELESIVFKALRKNKSERYQTIKRLLADLTNLRKRLEYEVEFGITEARHRTTEQQILATEQTKTMKTSAVARFKKQKYILISGLIIFLLAVSGFSYYFLIVKNSAFSVAEKKSVAVLPFVNSSLDPNAEYLSDGITESIINRLSRLSGLKVMSRNSAFRFKNDQTDTRNIAAQLNVETLVTGDIRQDGDQIVINVRLIKAADDTQIWGNRYVITSADTIAAQNEIAQAVAQNLRLKLTNAEQKQLGRNYTENVEAYQLYLQGRYHHYKLTLPEIRKGIEYYQRAIDLDPSYALAYAGIADAYRTIPLASWGVASKDSFPQAKIAARRALEIDPNLVEAHIVLGWVGFLYDWDLNAAEQELKKALEIAPDNSEAHRAYAHLFSITGRHNEAIAEIKLARELGPLSLITNALEGQFLFYAGRSDEAIDRLQKTLEIEPNFWIAHNNLGRVYIQMGRFDEAIAELDKAKELSSGGSTEPYWQLGYAYAKSGNREKAQAIIEELRTLSGQIYVPEYSFAMIHNGLGERDEALVYLERSYQQREVQLASVKIDQRWNWLRDDPRFVDLMKRMNFE